MLRNIRILKRFFCNRVVYQKGWILKVRPFTDGTGTRPEEFWAEHSIPDSKDWPGIPVGWNWIEKWIKEGKAEWAKPGLPYP